MDRNHSGSPLSGGVSHNGEPRLEDDPPIIAFEIAEYWYTLIDEKEAAPFLGVNERTLQAWRQTGDGPRFVRLSARAIRYRRVDLRQHAEERLVKSTADPGREVTEP